MPAPLQNLASGIIVATVQFLGLVAVVMASCSTGSSDQDNVISISFPSFERGTAFMYGGGSEWLRRSWDAGYLHGALHLTADDVYQPPIQELPDEQTSAGHAILRERIHLARGTELTSNFWKPGVPSEYIYVTEGPLSQEASFNTTFTMSVSRSSDQHMVTDGGLLLEVLPDANVRFHRANYFPLASTTSGNISVEVGKLEYYYHQGWFVVYVSILPPYPTTTTPNVLPPMRYTVWIDYNAARHCLSVYVDEVANPKPGNATLHAGLNISDIIPWVNGRGFTFGLFASKNRLSPSCRPVVYSWNLTVERLSYPCRPDFDFNRYPGDKGIHPVRWILGRLCSLVLWFLELLLQQLLSSAAVGVAAAGAMVSLTMKLKLSKVMRRLPAVLREFKYAEVSEATRSFDDSMKLVGTGRLGGAMYKGEIMAVAAATSDGDSGGRQRLPYVEVAVKKFARKENRTYDDILAVAELSLVNCLRHRNIVPLIGWCYENGELFLIYQYMANGSLDKHIFHEYDNRGSMQQRPILGWETLHNIIKDVAAGLRYVHHEYESVVLHRGIKASNILLDASFHGRLGDVGLTLDNNNSSTDDLGVTGGSIIIAPEYGVSHKATRQTDVHAFGVLVLEVVTGRRSLPLSGDELLPVLTVTDHVWRHHEMGRLLEAVDEELAAAGDFDANGATRLLLLGLACCNPNPSARPSMAEAVLVLAKSMPPPDVPPRKPTFVWPPEDDEALVGASHRDSDSTSHREDSERLGENGIVIATGISSSGIITRRRSRTKPEQSSK